MSDGPEIYGVEEPDEDGTRHFVVVLPDGTEISFYGPDPPPPEMMAMLPEVVAAVAKLQDLTDEERAELGRRQREAIERVRTRALRRKRKLSNGAEPG